MTDSLPRVGTPGRRLADRVSRIASLAVVSWFAVILDQGFGVSASWAFCAASAIIAFVLVAPLPL